MSRGSTTFGLRLVRRTIVVAIGVLAVGVGAALVGVLGLSERAAQEHVVYRQDLGNQSSRFGRVLYALAEALVEVERAAATQLPADVGKIQDVLDHATVPTRVVPEVLRRVVGSDPLRLAARVPEAEVVYERTLERVRDLVVQLSGAASSAQHLALLARAGVDLRAFLEAIRQRTTVLDQLENAYFAHFSRWSAVGRTYLVVSGIALATTAILAVLAVVVILRTIRAEIGRLGSLVTVCSYCRQVRQTSGAWSQMESYLTRAWGVQFSHGMCPECERKVTLEMEEQTRSLPRPPDR